MRPTISRTLFIVLALSALVLPDISHASDLWLSDCPEDVNHAQLGYWKEHDSPSVPTELLSTSPGEMTDSAPAEYAADCQPCGCAAACGGCGLLGRGWFDNTAFFFAGDGWKSIFDDDDNNNFGFRLGFNTGLALPGLSATRGQIGASYGAYDFHGREGLLGGDDPIEQQLFLTAGLYRRSDVPDGDRISWGAVYDVLFTENAGEGADDIRLAQIRGTIGYSIGNSDEIGVWAAFRLMSSFAQIEQARVNITDQVNAFWHHTWSYGGDTWLYVGWADDPGETVLGLRGEMPLNDRVALFGNFHYVIPGTRGGDMHPRLPVDDIFNQETWNVSFGIVFYPGAKAGSRTVSGDRCLPLLPVADNASFNMQAPMF
jgi:hypothetical protein